MRTHLPLSTPRILIITIAFFLLHTHVTQCLPLASTQRLDRLRRNLANSPPHTLSLSQPTSDLNPLVPVDPDAGQVQTQEQPGSAQDEETSITYLAAERGYARQAPLFESPSQQASRRKSEVRLLEYLA